MKLLTPEVLFQAASMVAMSGWLLLAAAPRSRRLMIGVRYGVVGVLCALYAGLILPSLGRLDPAAFMSLAGVKSLFGSDWVLLAGWVHYLAFDLVAGLWIAERCDDLGWSRVAQIPFLFLTLMLGPLGLLAFYVAVSVNYGLRR